MARLFVAVWLPEELRDVVAAVPRPEVEGVRWTRPDQWHVTLRFLGECEQEEVEAALAGLEAGVAAAEMGPVTEVLGRGVLMAPVQGLDEVAAAVVEATAEIGRPPEDRPFHGHLTLARAKQRRMASGLAGEPCAGSWTVEEVAVVQSRLHPKGAHYSTVATIPLRR